MPKEVREDEMYSVCSMKGICKSSCKILLTETERKSSFERTTHGRKNTIKTDL